METTIVTQILTQAEQTDRINKAKNYSFASWNGKVEPVEVSIRPDTIAFFGYEENDALYKKDGSSSLFWLARNCPVVQTDVEFETVLSIIGKSRNDLIKDAIATKYANESRAFMNKKVIETKVSKEKATKQSQMDALKLRMDAGEITAETYHKECMRIAGYNV
jgi:hypothetical protein